MSEPTLEELLDKWDELVSGQLKALRAILEDWRTLPGVDLSSHRITEDPDDIGYTLEARDGTE